MMEVEVNTNGWLSARFTEAERVELRSDYICVSEGTAEFDSTLPFEDVTVTVETRGKLGIYFGGSALAAQGNLKLKLLDGQVLCEGSTFRIRASGITVMASAEEEEA